MKLLLICRAGPVYAVFHSRAPEQARKRLRARFGPAEHLFATMASSDDAEIIPRILRRLGRQARLSDSELGSIGIAYAGVGNIDRAEASRLVSEVQGDVQRNRYPCMSWSVTVPASVSV